MSSLQWAGQRVIYSYPGLTVPSALLTAIEAGQCAGVIFFGENISSASQIAGVVSRLRAYTTGQLEPTAFDAALARVQALRSSLS
ncbi:hypothetical protein [Actinospica robiniae]|uniref:hypothetical protein n=1 Tax=Actinospica robiniae TaxID=304901 RepID=UPI00042524CB|nr:hypothetical protein [Actinospica robiniae]